MPLSWLDNLYTFVDLKESEKAHYFSINNVHFGLAFCWMHIYIFVIIVICLYYPRRFVLMNSDNQLLKRR